MQVFYDLTEASYYLDLQKSYVYRLVHLKKIKHYKPGGKKIYFKKEDLDSYILSGEVKTETEIENETVNHLKNRR